MTKHTLTALDVEILRFVTRFGMARLWHISAWTGARGGLVEQLGTLRKLGLVESYAVGLTLRTPEGRLTETITYAWSVTNRGARYVGEWAVPGTDQVVQMGRGKV